MEKKHFPAFYQEHVKRVYRFLFYRVGGNKELAEDLTQDVFIKALGAFEKYDPEVSQVSWILTIAKNHLLNHLQKTKTHVQLDEIENTLWDTENWPERLALRHDEQRLWSAIGQLPADDAELVRLKYVEGWSYEDMAEPLGKQPGALRVQAHRALKQLKTILKQK